MSVDSSWFGVFDNGASTFFSFVFRFLESTSNRNTHCPNLLKTRLNSSNCELSDLRWAFFPVQICKCICWLLLLKIARLFSYFILLSDLFFFSFLLPVSSTHSLSQTFQVR